MSLAVRVDLSQSLVATLIGNELVARGDVIASTAMERLRLLRIEMEGTLAHCTNDRALGLLREYEEKLEDLLSFVAADLNGRGLSKYREQLLCENALVRMKKLIEEGGSLLKIIEETFQQEVNNVDEAFPQELEAYISDVIKKVQETLSFKDRSCKEQSTFYLEKVRAMTVFLQETSKILPSYSLYGDELGAMFEQEKKLSIQTEALIKRLQNVVQPDGLLEQIREKIKETVQKIERNKEVAFTQLKEELNKCISQSDRELEHSVALVDILQRANKIYVEQINHYLSLVSNGVNELIAGVETEVSIAMRIQDEQLLHLTKKSEAISDFFNHQIKRVLELVQAHQKPIVSKAVGIQRGAAFDDQRYAAYGRISKIEVRAGFIIDRLQIFYQNAEGREIAGNYRGGIGGELNTIVLNPKERIIRVEVGTGAFKGVAKSAGFVCEGGVEELTFYSDQGRQFGPYGGRGCPKGVRWLKNRDRLKYLKVHTIEFGPDYYLGALAGRSSHYMHSISFVFFKNFAPQIQKDLSDRISAVLRLAKNDPECQLSKDEEAEIKNAFAQMYINLSKRQTSYEVLELSPDATLKEVKNARRLLALKYHPDKLPEQDRWKAHLYRVRYDEVQDAYKSIISSGAHKSAKLTA